MYIRIALIAALVCSFLQLNSAEFPNDPKPCKFGDEDCLLKAINFYLREKNQGDPSINLPQIDPIDAGTFTLKQGADNPVNIDLTFSNNKIYGVANATASKVRGFGKDLTKKHELRFKVPVASLIGDYKIQGRILILPISGSGKNNITMIDAEFILQWVGAPVEKDGATYMKTDKFRAIVKPSRVFFELQNLFNGDKALGDNMNLFLNENWKEIFQEVEVSYSKELSKLMSSIIDSVFDKTPYNKLFVELTEKRVNVSSSTFFDVCTREIFVEMFQLNKIVLALMSLLALQVVAKFPEDPKACKYGDKACIMSTIEYLMREKSQGFASLNLAKTEPLRIAKIVMKQGAESPVNIDLTFTNNDLYGFSAVKMIDLKGFGRDLTTKHELLFSAPILSLAGDYSIKGRVLILPITGTGTSNITMLNSKIRIQFAGTPVSKPDGVHMNVKSARLSVDPSRMIFNFGNLFNGDKQLGDTMNSFLNENWKEIYEEVRATFTNAFSQIFTSVIDSVFSKYPYDKYFSE
nr:uncharacterized protein LOC106617054 [Bactrocera oleae]